MSDQATETTTSAAHGLQACSPLRESRRPPCPVCQAPMEPEHAHHKCPDCGYIEPCCGW